MRKIILLFFTGTLLMNAQEFSPALEDNSFFIEEAYNQEAGIFQHIFKAEFQETEDFALTFTEEIPLMSEKHQFSLEMEYLSLNKRVTKGIGDLKLQYRYMIFGKKDWAAAAPAFSVIVPAGTRDEGLGTATAGYEIMLPLSRRLSEYFTAHLNAGISWFPYEDQTQSEYFGGGSLIWLALPKLNFHFEMLFSASYEGEEISSEHMFIPGLRYAIDIGDLQIVTGGAAALNTTRDTKEMIVLYLSFEHPL